MFYIPTKYEENRRTLLITVPPDPIPSNKTFSKFQKGLSPPVNLKPPEPFPTPINGKSIKWTPWKRLSHHPSGG